MEMFTLDKLPHRVLAKIDLQSAFLASRCILAAEKFEVFRKLSGQKLTAAAICRKIGVKAVRGKFYVAALHSLGLLKKQGDLYSNSALAEKYFVRKRSIYWTRVYSEECLEEYRAFSVLEKMLTTGRSYESILGIRRQYYMDKMKSNPAWARDFTHMLYHHHLEAASALAKALDLKGYRTLLDVGGGSGVMSLALVRKFKNLTATVLDIEPVCKVAKQIIRREKLSARVKTIVGDMTKKVPSGFEVVMFCDAGGTSAETLSLVYDSLPQGGMIVLADFFSSEDYTEPLLRLMWQLRSDNPWLVTRKEAMAALRRIGFKAVKRRRITSNVWLLTGIKK